MNVADLRARAAAQSAMTPPPDHVALRKAQPPSRESLRRARYTQDTEPGAPTSVVETLLMEKSADPGVQALQKFNDDCLLLSQLIKTPVEDLGYFQEHMAKGHPLRKALDSAEATGGAEWIPTGFSADLIRFVNLENKVPGLFRYVDMPTDPYPIPYVNAEIVVQKLTEQTADAGTKIADVSPAATGKITLTGVKYGGRVPWSTELSERSIVPMLPYLREDIAKAVLRAEEYAMINGDDDGSHIDSDIGASATHRGILWKGLRRQALGTATFNMSLSGGFTAANLGKLRALMGKYGGNPSDLAWIVGPKVYARHFMTLADVVSREKFGDQATVVSGVLTKYQGIDIVVSNELREDLATNGRYDGTTTDNGSVLLVYKPAWWFGKSRKLTIKVWEDVQYDQFYIVATAIGDFKTARTADAVVVAGIDIDLS